MKQKYYVELNRQEWRLIIEGLSRFRNKLIAAGRYTDAVDEIFQSRQGKAAEVNVVGMEALMMEKYITDERTGLKYELVGDYYLIAGEDEPEDDEPGKGQASGSAFEDIDMAVRTIKKDSPSEAEMRHAGKVMTELDGTELYSRITERLTDEAMSERLAKAMAVFVDTVNTTVAQAKSKVFVVPDNIEEFDIRNYV